MKLDSSFSLAARGASEIGYVDLTCPVRPDRYRTSSSITVLQSMILTVSATEEVYVS